MKILIIDEDINRVGGVERVICTLANRLSENHEVTVISEYKSSATPFYNYDKNIELKYLINNSMNKTGKMNSKNVKYYLYRAIEKIKSFVYLRKRIKTLFSDYKNVDIIIFGRVFVALDFFPILKKNKEMTVIVRDAIHIKYYSEKVKKKMLKYFPKMVNYFIVSSDESINEYKRFFDTDTLNLVKIYNPIGIKPNIAYNLKNKTIVSIGRMDSQKGYDSLIRSFAYIHQLHPDWNLKLYGNGNYEKYLQKLIDDLTLTTCVEILPSIKNVVEIFNKSSIFVLPSRYEGYANVLVEAMSCGMPCVSYNWLMGVEEIIEDGKNGFVVYLQNRNDYFNGIYSEKDVKNLAKKINYMIDNPKVCQKISKEAVKIIESRQLEKIINEWLKLIDYDENKKR